jgi:Flp pilus assembly protein TadG
VLRKRDLQKIKSENGAAVVEFAVVVPLLLILVFGIIEFGILIYNKAMITNASREGAREGILFRDDRSGLETDIQNTINTYLSDYLISFGTPTPPTWISDPADVTTLHSGDHLTITVEYDYDFLLVPGFIETIGPSLKLSAATTLRAE